MLKDKMKTYNFWISLVSAVLLVARLIAGKFNVEIDSSLVMDVTTGLCGIFVVLGIISAPQKTVTKFIDRPLDNSASLVADSQQIEDVFTSLSSRASVLAKNFETNSAALWGQPNANKASTCHSNVERQISSSCDEVAIPSLSEEATVNSEASAPLGEDGRVATEGVISSLSTALRIDDAETEVATLSELDTAGVTQSEEDVGVVIESQGNANESINQMPVISEGIDQMPVISEGIDQMPNLAEFSKEQLIEIICANPQFLNVGKNSN